MASGFTTLTNDHLIRDQVWSRQLKELLLDDLQAMKMVRVLSDFPDGDTLNIPSIGEAQVDDFEEGQAIRYNKMDTGNFQFQFDQYKYSAHSISEKFKRDSYYASDVIAAFVPRQHRAIMEAVETRIFDRANAMQTAGSANTINGAAHRLIGTGTGESITQTDILKARYALTKANVPLNNLCAVVDPTVTFTLSNNANAVNLLSPMPMYEDINKNGLVTGYRFRFNFAGFDIYESNYLPRVTESISSSTASAGVVNMFFSATPGDTLPIVGGYRQTPTVQSEFNKDLQQWEHLTIAEYGFKGYRPENLVSIITDTDIVA